MVQAGCYGVRTAIRFNRGGRGGGFRRNEKTRNEILCNPCATNFRWPNLLLVFVFFSSPPFCAKTAPATYGSESIDKAQTPYSLTAPEAYLSQRALERRQRQNIAIDSLDLPVDPAYIAQLLASGDMQLLNRSKSYNAVTIRSTDTLALDTLGLLPFVHVIRILVDGNVPPARRLPTSLAALLNPTPMITALPTARLK